MTFPKLIVRYAEEEVLFDGMQLFSLLQFFKEETRNTRSHEKAWLQVDEFNFLVENMKQLLHTVIIKKRSENIKRKISWLKKTLQKGNSTNEYQSKVYYDDMKDLPVTCIVDKSKEMIEIIFNCDAESGRKHFHKFLKALTLTSYVQDIWLF